MLITRYMLIITNENTPSYLFLTLVSETEFW